MRQALYVLLKFLGSIRMLMEFVYLPWWVVEKYTRA